jgi:hypothetical protein
VRRRLTALGVLVACLAGCDGGSSIDPEADEELIEDAMLTLDDLPEGFREVDADDDDQGAADECNEDILGIGADELDEATTAEPGPVRFDSDSVSVVAEITAFDDGDDLVRIVEALGDDEYVDCLREEAEDFQDPGVTIVGIESIDSPADDDDTPAGAVAAVVEINSPSTSGIVVAAEQQQHAVVVDRFGILLTISAEEGLLDEELVEDSLDAMIDRLRDGLEDA